MQNDYLERILNAAVYDVAIESPLDFAPNLSARSHNRIFLKREDMQPVFSFKIRGAYNKMAQLPADVLARGVITASAGNHAQGVALSAARLGCRAVIAVPTTTPQVKIDAIRAHGIDFHLRRRDRHADHRFHAEPRRRQRHALRVIARRRRNHAALQLFRRQMRHLVVRAAQLERENRLVVLALEQDRVA